jgi:peroxiredoxin family protein
LSATPEPIAVFLHSGDYDRVHQGLSIAAAGGAAGRPVAVYFFWWALERLLRDDLDAPAFLAGAAPDCRTEDVAEAFVEAGFPSLRRLLEAARATGNVRVYACSGSLAILGRHAGAVEGKVDELVGWTTILARTAGVTDRFYL